MKESPAPGEQRRVVLLGATGSIGQQVLDVVRRNRDQFRLVGLAGGGGDVAGLAAAAMEFGVEVVAVARGTVAQDLQLAFYAAAKAHGWSAGEFQVPKLLVGPDAATELAAMPCDIVLNGITGSVGLGPTLAALDAGTTLALANKESLIAGGSLVLSRAKPGQLVPVDSEHSALAQCLRGGRADEVRKLVLTASGGPFRGRSREQMAGVTVAEALAHPTWAMGPVITINSATLVNKGLELIEAHLLFGIDVDAIDVVVHPQSVVHSMVEFHDGSTLAQCSPPDMRLPIAMALGWPDRVAGAASAVDWTAAQSWTFEPLDAAAFPSVDLARAAARTGGLAPAVYNAANEELVAGFAHGLVGFTAIVDTIDAVLGQADPHLLAAPTTIEEVVAAEQWARARAREIAGLPADYAVRMPPVRVEGSPVA